ncbi:hypothetical protein M422DRAFT_780601 [Sphaerobolus stellatus SS14]|uniref:Uncharacterized protein n=1 Tax=Sphaerobolus stellatus (strain SS14) TaxID=990650 RepID=A0A0C9VHS8_SPHS4|nr:hypothetical protein M422DRAFT_780601 [Sphaerobolus stellatus SS14]
MAPLHFTIQDFSPLISYSSNWSEGSNLDQIIPTDYCGTFWFTDVSNAAASFTFTGTGISIFGSQRTNHGNYSVQLDDGPVLLFEGYHNPDIFRQSLWSTSNLQFKEHTVKITNVPINTRNMLDIDYITVERMVGPDDGDVYEHKLDDTSGSIQYTPSGSWTLTEAATAGFNGTMHRAAAVNATMAITFNGCCLEVHGRSDGFKYSVTLDNEKPKLYEGLHMESNGSQEDLNTVLYFVDGLPVNVTHKLTLQIIEASEERPFNFDYVVLQTSVPRNVLMGPSNQSSTGAAQGSPKLHLIGAVIGGVVGGFIILSLIFVRCFFNPWQCSRQKTKKRKHGKGTDTLTASFAFTSVTPSIPSPVREFPPGHRFPTGSGSREVARRPPPRQSRANEDRPYDDTNSINSNFLDLKPPSSGKQRNQDVPILRLPGLNPKTPSKPLGIPADSERGSSDSERGSSDSKRGSSDSQAVIDLKADPIS